MAETTNISLSKALRLRKRLKEEIGVLNDRIIANNSIIKGSQREYEVAELMKKREQTVYALVALKISLLQANAQVQQKLLMLDESKAKITLLNSIDTRHGPALAGHFSQEATIEYDAQLRKVNVDKEIKMQEKLIDQLQDEIDRFNATHEIAVSTELLK